MRTNTRGFTLVELSIVLVIIGLLIGGVMVGKSLIHASQLRGVTSSFLTYEAAIHNFRDQYGTLPGDMPNANKYWSTATNGPGASRFGNYSNGAFAWQHLSLAGLIAGNFPGTQANGAAGACVFDVECPSASMDGLGFLTLNNYVGATPPYTTGSKDGIFLYDGTNGDFGTGMTPLDASKIDSKMDDGFPGTGHIFGFGNGGLLNGDGWDNCSIDAAGSSYAFANKTTVCRLFYTIQ